MSAIVESSLLPAACDSVIDSFEVLSISGIESSICFVERQKERVSFSQQDRSQTEAKAEVDTISIDRNTASVDVILRIEQVYHLPVHFTETCNNAFDIHYYSNRFGRWPPADRSAAPARTKPRFSRFSPVRNVLARI
jgi:hypothetical protein